MPSAENIRQRIQQNALFYLASILIALSLKQYYSQASAEALGWILKPIAGLVAYITGDEFSFKAGTGYICDTQRVIIAPACAGVNFMLMAFGMSVFTGIHHMKRHWYRFLWLVFEPGGGVWPDRIRQHPAHYGIHSYIPRGYFQQRFGVGSGASAGRGRYLFLFSISFLFYDTENHQKI